MKLWRCPACGAEHATNIAAPHTPFHACRANAGLTIPFVEAGVRATLIVREREDYLGDDAGLEQRDANGRVVMAVETVRDDGNDWTVYAPSARVGREG